MISVLIPVYNGEKYLAKAIESVLSQTYTDYEILVIDDGSSDGTAEIAMVFRQVRYIFQPHAGVSAARNRGIREAKGSIIAFLDADDLFTPEKLSKQEVYLEQHPECMICYSEISNFSELPSEELTDRQRQLLSTDVQVILPSACIRREIFSTYGYFDESLPYGEDTEWLLRLKLLHMAESHTLPEKLYLRRVHTGNLSLTHPHTQQDTMGFLCAKGVTNSRRIKAGRKVSVILPAYQAESYLEEALCSVYRQQWLGELEIIVVDNNSSDHTVEVASKHNLMVLSEPQKGAAFARNRGILAASGDFIFLLDADDRLTDHAAEALFQPMDADSGIQCVFGKATDFISEEIPKEEKAKLRPRLEAYSGRLTGCSLIRRAVFDRIGLFDTSLTSGETIEWMARLKDSGIACKALNDVVLNRRLHVTNTGRLSAEEEWKNYAAILRKRMPKK